MQRHTEVGKSSFGRTIVFKDEAGERKIFVGLSFEEAAEIAKELIS
ncbi:MAG: hypothetical protein ABFC78_02890 [Methanoregula sp.]